MVFGCFSRNSLNLWFLEAKCCCCCCWRCCGFRSNGSCSKIHSPLYFFPLFHLIFPFFKYFFIDKVEGNNKNSKQKIIVKEEQAQWIFWVIQIVIPRPLFIISPPRLFLRLFTIFTKTSQSSNIFHLLSSFPPFSACFP